MEAKQQRAAVQFDGGVFSKDIPDGRAAARITLGPGAIEATTAAGQAFHLPYQQCRLERGGASGRMIFCRSPDRSLTIFCEQPGFGRALAARSGGALTDQLKTLFQRAGREQKRGRVIALGVIAALALLLFGGYHGILAGARLVVKSLPIEIDERIGELAVETMDLKGEEVTDPVVVKAIEEMVDRLRPQAAVKQFDFRVRVVDAPVLNAFALPGGRIVVYTGLIEKAAEAEQVAGVIGHEMAHVTLRHGLERISGSIGVMAAIQLLLGDATGMMAIGRELLQTGAITSYSREQESEADMEALRMLHAARIDATGLARFFDLLEKEQGELPEAVTWFSSHPQLSDRSGALREKAGELAARGIQDFSFDWQLVRRHAREPENKKGADKKGVDKKAAGSDNPDSGTFGAYEGKVGGVGDP